MRALSIVGLAFWMCVGGCDAEDGQPTGPDMAVPSHIGDAGGACWNWQPTPDGGFCLPADAGPYPVTCFNGQRDGDETDGDCGGSCPGCAPGKTCAKNDDCASGLCQANACLPPPCANGVRDGDEADVDCGGSCAARCANGAHCAGPADCVSGFCVAGACPAAFTRQADVTIATPPTSVGLVDLNGDGKLDLVTASDAGDSVSVALGRGDGTFGAPSTVAAGARPVGLALGDLDGDGHADVVVANGGSFGTMGGVSVLLGKGDGTLRAAATREGGYEPKYVALADVDGDGRGDVVVLTWLGGKLGVFRGTGGGGIANVVEQDAAGKAGGMAIGDMNGDGRPDVAVSGGDLLVFLNNGAGAFAAAESYRARVGGDDSPVLLRDFNGDGKLDTVVGAGLYAGAGTITFLSGAGDGRFGSAVTTNVDGRDGYALAAADFDRDGDLDLVTGGMSTLAGRGDGTFARPASLGSGAVAVAVGDLDGDGRADIVGAAMNGVRVWMNRLP